MELLISFLRQNLRSMRLTTREIGPLGTDDAPSGVHVSIYVDLPSGGTINLLKVSGAHTIREHDNRAGYSEFATKPSLDARRNRVGGTNQANLAISNVLGWLALDSINSMSSPGGTLRRNTRDEQSSSAMNSTTKSAVF